RGPAGVCLDRPGHRLVGHLRGDPDDLGPAAVGLSFIPASVRAKFHARGYSLIGQSSSPTVAPLQHSVPVFSARLFLRSRSDGIAMQLRVLGAIGLAVLTAAPAMAADVAVPVPVYVPPP